MQAAEGKTLEAEMEFFHQLRQYFASLPVDRFPNIVRLSGPLVDVEQDRFQLGLDVLLAGLVAVTLPAAP